MRQRVEHVLPCAPAHPAAPDISVGFDATNDSMVVRLEKDGHFKEHVLENALNEGHQGMRNFMNSVISEDRDFFLGLYHDKVARGQAV